jgi:hypothetical protein
MLQASHLDRRGAKHRNWETVQILLEGAAVKLCLAKFPESSLWEEWEEEECESVFTLLQAASCTGRKHHYESNAS